MRAFTGVGLLVLPLLFTAQVAAGTREELLSRSATIPGGDTSALVFQVPNGHVYLMRQACVGDEPIALVGSVLGEVPLAASTDPQGPCTLYEPGVLFLGGETITCQRIPPFLTAEPATCLINGALRKEA